MRCESGDLAEYLDAATARSPHARAVVGADGTALTYVELSEAADKIAAYLHEQGVGVGDRVGLLLAKGPAVLAAIFGVLRLGAAYVPADPIGSPRRAAWIFNDCGVRLVFADHESARRLAEVSPAPTAHTTELTSIMEDFTKGAAYPIAAPDTNRLAYLLYTSGSTGTPKGVAISHGNAIAFVEWASSEFAVTTRDQLASHAPIHFDLSVLDIFVTAKNAACVHLIDTDLAASPRHLPRFIAERGITVWYSAPTILGMIADQHQRRPPPANRLRLVLFAGEVFPITTLRALTRIWPEPAYYNLYGPTETNVCTFHHVHLPIPADRTEPLPIGWACAHCHTMVVDEYHHPVPEGQRGFLCVAGPSVFPSYWNTPEQTRSRFVQHGGRHWYNTGDIVRQSTEGYLFLGRADRMVKCHGHRVELDEIQHCLTTHPDLAAAAVVATGSCGGMSITAFLVPRATRTSTTDMFRFCRDRLARYMVPDRFQFLPGIPLTSTGKTDYQFLERQCRTELTNGG